MAVKEQVLSEGLEDFFFNAIFLLFYLVLFLIIENKNYS